MAEKKNRLAVANTGWAETIPQWLKDELEPECMALGFADKGVGKVGDDEAQELDDLKHDLYRKRDGEISDPFLSLIPPLEISEAGGGGVSDPMPYDISGFHLCRCPCGAVWI